MGRVQEGNANAARCGAWLRLAAISLRWIAITYWYSYSGLVWTSSPGGTDLTSTLVPCRWRSRPGWQRERRTRCGQPRLYHRSVSVAPIPYPAPKPLERRVASASIDLRILCIANRLACAGSPPTDVDLLRPRRVVSQPVPHASRSLPSARKSSRPALARAVVSLPDRTIAPDNGRGFPASSRTHEMRAS